MELLELKKIVPNSENWIEAKALTRGNSPDQKYSAKDNTGRKYVLRLSKEDLYESKKQIFDRMKLAWTADIPMPEPIAFGKAADGTVYSLFSWLEGIDADTYIGDLSESEQYAFGIEIGKIQKKLHSFPARGSDNFDWYEKFKNQKNELLDWYKSSGLKVQYDDAIINCILENEDLMKSRPVTLVHGDYQISNFLIMPDGHAGIIDFDYIKYSDPMQETQALTIYTRPTSIPVAVGQIDGYFDNAPTPEFFRMMKFYTAFNMFAGLHWWAVTYGEGGVSHYTNIIKICCDDYDAFKLDIPMWYTDMKNK